MATADQVEIVWHVRNVRRPSISVAVSPEWEMTREPTPRPQASLRYECADSGLEAVGDLTRVRRP